MPANLPPDYFEAEKRYRAAKTPTEKIACLEEMLTIMPKHKGTDKLRAGLRKRISKLKSASQTKKSVGKRDSAFQIDKEGAGQVVLVGPANVGKSALVATLTNATPEVADFPLTTWKPTPGMMPVENIQIQLVDTPPLNRDYVEPELLALIRRSDFILLVVDLHTDPIQQLEDTVALLQEHRIVPSHLQDLTNEQRGFAFIPFLVLANKNDDETTDENLEIFRELLEGDWPLLSVSANTGRNLELLKQTLVAQLNIIRVYSKAPGKEPDLTSPFVLKKGSTVAEFAGKVHKDFVEKLKIAKVWGNAVYDGQMVQRDHILEDGDVVELHI
ncbi:MAG: TGS domain-containing protein [Deltaproteobacteria bacterium]|nr:MAG: TGS domain-containing protein [Deltaproteobacteria bacterium]